VNSLSTFLKNTIKELQRDVECIVLCPLQHKSFVLTVKGVSGKELDEMTTAKINIAFETGCKSTKMQQ
jgi:hypothetical protein